MMQGPNQGATFFIMLKSLILLVATYFGDMGCCFNGGGFCWLFPSSDDQNYLSVNDPQPIKLGLWTICGNYYIIVGSLTPYFPGYGGIDFGICDLNLMIDDYFWVLLGSPDQWIKPSAMHYPAQTGFFATLTIEPEYIPPSWKGLSVYHAGLIFDNDLLFTGITNTLETEIGL